MINEIRRGFNVKRFHTSVRVQEETVGHHSANVCAILIRLVPDVSRDLLVAALFHDVAEVYTGDVPAPFKWENPHIAKGLRTGEEKYFERWNLPAPTEWDELHDDDLALLKLADTLDLVLSCYEEIGRGNTYAQRVIRRCMPRITKMPAYAEHATAIRDMIWEVQHQHGC